MISSSKKLIPIVATIICTLLTTGCGNGADKRPSRTPTDDLVETFLAVQKSVAEGDYEAFKTFLGPDFHRLANASPDLFRNEIFLPCVTKHGKEIHKLITGEKLFVVEGDFPDMPLRNIPSIYRLDSSGKIVLVFPDDTVMNELGECQTATREFFENDVFFDFEDSASRRTPEWVAKISVFLNKKKGFISTTYLRDLPDETEVEQCLANAHESDAWINSLSEIQSQIENRPGPLDAKSKRLLLNNTIRLINSASHINSFAEDDSEYNSGNPFANAGKEREAEKKRKAREELEAELRRDGIAVLFKLHGLLTNSLELDSDNSDDMVKILVKYKEEYWRRLAEADKMEMMEAKKKRQREIDELEKRFESDIVEDKYWLFDKYVTAVNDPESYYSGDDLKQLEKLMEDADSTFEIHVREVLPEEIVAQFPQKRIIPITDKDFRCTMCMPSSSHSLRNVSEETPFRLSENGKWEIVQPGNR